MSQPKKQNFIVRHFLNKLTRRPTDHKPRQDLCDFGRICHEIIPGDVLLMEGSSAVSKLIKRVTRSYWTHASLYIGRLHSIEDPETRQLIIQHYACDPADQLLLETWPGQGTVIYPITRYRKEHIRICRPTGISYEDTQKVINYAVSHVGREYNMRHFFDLGRYLIASKWLPARWGSSLFKKHKPTQTSKDICSALIAEAFVSVNFPILPLILEEKNGKTTMIHRNPKLFIPSDFDYSPYFNIIKYPIIPGQGKAQYHNYPWDLTKVNNDKFVTDHDEQEKKSD
jgi:hypothetical protein